MMGMGVNGLIYTFVAISQEIVSPRQGVLLICAFGHRLTGAGRSRHARGANASWARGDEYQGGRNDFLRFQEQLLRRKKQKLFLGVSVGNGVRGGITLHKIGGGSAIKVNFIALALHYLCKRKANGLR